MADNSLQLTVVINVHREGRQLHPTIKSATRSLERARASGLTGELLLILDTPDPETKEYCLEFLPPNTRVQEISVRDLGLARNAGVQAAEGEYVAFLDGDDLFAPNWLECAHNFMQSDDRELVLHPSLVIYFENRQATWNLIDQEDPTFCRSVLLEHNLWPALSFAKRSTYLKVPFRSSALKDGFGYEDWLFNCDSIAAGMIHKVVPNTVHCIREKSWKRSLLRDTISSNCIISESKLFCLGWQKQN